METEVKYLLERTCLASKMITRTARPSVHHWAYCIGAFFVFGRKAGLSSSASSIVLSPFVPEELSISFLPSILSLLHSYSLLSLSIHQLTESSCKGNLSHSKIIWAFPTWNAWWGQVINVCNVFYFNAAEDAVSQLMHSFVICVLIDT